MILLAIQKYLYKTYNNFTKKYLNILVKNHYNHKKKYLTLFEITSPPIFKYIFCSLYNNGDHV